MAAQIFPFGTALTIVWHFSKPDGTDFDLNGYIYRIYYRTGNKETEVGSSRVSRDGNVLSFTIPADEPVAPGEYALRLNLFQNGQLLCKFNYNAAFVLSRQLGELTPVESQQQASQIVHLYTVSEYYLLSPVVPTVGDDGYWYVNGTKITDGNGEYIPSNHTVRYDSTTRYIIIDEGRVDKDGNSIQQTITDIDTVLDAVESAETTRQKNEGQLGSDDPDYATSRIKKEIDRQAAETTRQSSETARLKAEGQFGSDDPDYATSRIKKESDRQAAETSRATAETDRATKETARQKAEGQLGDTDPDYASSRIKKEIDRQTAETARANAETQRLNNEGIGETDAECAAGSRRKNESERVAAEALRVQAETAREERASADHTTAVSDHTTWAGYRLVVKTVGDTAPGSPSNGDKWYKTTDNKVYTYSTSTSDWDSGVAATTGATIVNSTTNDVYVFNGSSLDNYADDINQLGQEVIGVDSITLRKGNINATSGVIGANYAMYVYSDAITGPFTIKVNSNYYIYDIWKFASKTATTGSEKIMNDTTKTVESYTVNVSGYYRFCIQKKDTSNFTFDANNVCTEDVIKTVFNGLRKDIAQLDVDGKFTNGDTPSDYGIDNTPTDNSGNLVKSGGVSNFVKNNISYFDKTDLSSQINVDGYVSVTGSISDVGTTYNRSNPIAVQCGDIVKLTTNAPNVGIFAQVTSEGSVLALKGIGFASGASDYYLEIDWDGYLMVSASKVSKDCTLYRNAAYHRKQQRVIRNLALLDAGVWVKNTSDVSERTTQTYAQGNYIVKDIYNSIRSAKFYGFDSSIKRTVYAVYKNYSGNFRLIVNRYDESTSSWVTDVDSGNINYNTINPNNGTFSYTYSNGSKKAVFVIEPSVLLNGNVNSVSTPYFIFSPSCYEEQQSSLQVSSPLRLYPNKPLACLSFVFDDITDYDDSVVELFESYGLKTAFAIVVDTETSVPSGHIRHPYTDYVQKYLEFNQRGHSILSHSARRGVPFISSNYTQQTAIASLQDSKNNLEKYGMIVNGFVAPESTMDAEFVPLVQQTYSYGFTRNDGYTGKHIGNPCCIVRESMEAQTLSYLKGRIDIAVNFGYNFVFYGHLNNLGNTYNGEEFTIDKIEDIIEYALQKRDEGKLFIGSPDECMEYFYGSESNNQHISGACGTITPTHKAHYYLHSATSATFTKLTVPVDYDIVIETSAEYTSGITFGNGYVFAGGSAPAFGASEKWYIKVIQEMVIATKIG